MLRQGHACMHACVRACEGIWAGLGGKGKRPPEGRSAARSQGGHCVASKALWYQALCQDQVVLGTAHCVP